MKIRTSYIRITLIGFYIVSIFTCVIFCTSYPIVIKNIKSNCDWLLEDAISKTHSKDVNKMPANTVRGAKKDVYSSRVNAFVENDIKFDRYHDSINFFTENEEWEYRTTILHGKYFGRKVNKKGKIVDYLIYESDIYKKNKINLDSIIKTYNQTLQSKNIFINSPIYLKVSSDLYDMVYHNFPEDTIVKYNYLPPPYHTGYMDEVIYQAYLNISFITVYKAMNSNLLNFLYGILAILLILSIWLKLDEIKKKINPVIKPLGNNNYQVGHLNFILEDKKLYHNKVGYSMTAKTAEILLLMLQDPQYRVSTRKLMENCIHMENMTSAMSRVKKALKESDCPFRIMHLTGDPYYTLEPIYKTEGSDPSIVKWMISTLTVRLNNYLQSMKSRLLRFLERLIRCLE